MKNVQGVYMRFFECDTFLPLKGRVYLCENYILSFKMNIVESSKVICKQKRLILNNNVRIVIGSKLYLESLITTFFLGYHSPHILGLSEN